MSKPLRVWATRPLNQNTYWCDTLHQNGFDVLAIPLMDIHPVSTASATQAVKNAILSFDENQKVIFVSQNAVEHTFRQLHNFWPQLPVGIEYYAVGKKTAECVCQQGLDVVGCNEAMNSDELLALLSLQSVADQKILICRGKGGLPKIGEVLSERGANVRYCELYERSLPEHSVARAAPYLEALSERDVVALFSGETLENFTRVLFENQFESRDMTILVPGARVAQLAQSLGFTRVVIAKNASADVMLKALIQFRLSSVTDNEAH